MRYAAPLCFRHGCRHVDAAADAMPIRATLLMPYAFSFSMR